MTTFHLEEGDLVIGYVDGVEAGPVATWFSVGPVLQPISNQQLYLNAVQANPVIVINISLDDPDSDPSKLVVVTTSSNQVLLKNSDITIIVSCVARTLTSFTNAHFIHKHLLHSLTRRERGRRAS